MQIISIRLIKTGKSAIETISSSPCQLLEAWNFLEAQNVDPKIFFLYIARVDFFE